MAGDTERKSRRSKKRSKQEPTSSPGPPSIVCSINDSTASRNSIELGLILSLCTIGLYLYGFVESLQGLPEVAHARWIGSNLNLARLEPNDLAEGPSKMVASASAASRQGSPSAGSDNHFQVPETKWPVTLQDETEDDMELMVHPGDKKTPMKVPKFWSPPLHNKQFFTREQAMQIGSCVTPDPKTGSHVRGDECPMEERTIFVAIASYRDFECRSTVESLFNTASNPHRIRVGKL